jgi:hypothetical protein
MNTCFSQLCIEERGEISILHQNDIIPKSFTSNRHTLQLVLFFFHRQVYEAKEEGKVLAALYIFQSRNTVAGREK